MKSILLMPLKQRGSMLVMSVFIIIVMSVMGLAMSSMLSNSAEAVVAEVYGLRAKMAAHSGLEDQLLKVFPHTGPADITQCDVTSKTFSNIPGLENCGYSRSCGVKSYTMSSGNRLLFTFSSTGTCEVGEVKTSRTIKLEVID
ncbi:type II secretory pathway protein [Neptunicella sp.]|uniref:type II secretory pathway protein n=1 Tax=Neptunicella sp. TaxID=2125986 RepID=UPI003F694670